jgi:hypothetical protein
VHVPELGGRRAARAGSREGQPPPRAHGTEGPINIYLISRYILGSTKKDIY